MKKIILTALFSLTLVQQAHASLRLKCNSVADFPSDIHVVVLGESLLECHDKNNEPYTVTYTGAGLGFQISADAPTRMYCPTVNKSRLDENQELVLGAIKVNAAIFGGGNAGVAVNFKHGTCFFGGVHLGIGASASIGEMTIYKKDVQTVLKDREEGFFLLK